VLKIFVIQAGYNVFPYLMQKYYWRETTKKAENLTAKIKEN
jgi:hypothetical protein